MVRSVRKSYYIDIDNIYQCRVVSLQFEAPSPTSPYGALENSEKTDHEALCDIRRCCAIRLVLVRLADLQRVDDSREPIDELVEVHARGVLARGGRPVVL